MFGGIGSDSRNTTIRSFGTAQAKVHKIASDGVLYLGKCLVHVSMGNLIDFGEFENINRHLLHR